MNKNLYIRPKKGGTLGKKQICTMKKPGLLEVLEGLEDNRRKLSAWYPATIFCCIDYHSPINNETIYDNLQKTYANRKMWTKKDMAVVK